MGNHLPMTTLEYLGLFVTLIIKEGRETNLLPEVRSVYLWATHMERKDGNYSIWTPTHILYQETLIFLKLNFPLERPL